MIAGDSHDLTVRGEPAPGGRVAAAGPLLAFDDENSAVVASGCTGQGRADVGRSPLQVREPPRVRVRKKAADADASHAPQVREPSALEAAQNAGVVAETLAEIVEPAEEADGAWRVPLQPGSASARRT